MRNSIRQTAVGMAVAVAVGAGLLSAAARGDVITHGAYSLTMAFVDIGNPGNTVDTAGGARAGRGSVAYAYRIGTYEVSQNQWDTVNTAASIGDPGGTWTGSQPVANISWHNAAMFSNWLTSGSGTSGYYTITGSGDTATAAPNALSHAAYAAANGTTYFIPTEDEWYKAAYYSPAGPTYSDFATGSDTAPTAVASGTTANTAVWDGQGAPAAIDNSGGLSPYLTMGQGGNVYEWTETLTGSSRWVRGGSYATTGNFYVSAAGRLGYAPTLEDVNIGFRVASIGVVPVPEPASALLLVLAALGLMARRRR